MLQASAQGASSRSLSVRSMRYGAQPLHAIRSPTTTHSRTQATALTGYRQFLFEPTLPACLALARLNGCSQACLTLHRTVKLPYGNCRPCLSGFSPDWARVTAGCRGYPPVCAGEIYKQRR